MEKKFRIGNIVYGIYEDENGKQQKNICEILALDSTSSLGDGWWAIATRIEGDDTEEYDDFKPIPLTEDWLLRMGFYRNNNTWEDPKKNNTDFSLCNTKGENEFTLNDTLFNTKVKYIHELQNLYYVLTGIELWMQF
jgi:hypothetical protein